MYSASEREAPYFPSETGNDDSDDLWTTTTKSKPGKKRKTKGADTDDSFTSSLTLNSDKLSNTKTADGSAVRPITLWKPRILNGLLFLLFISLTAGAIYYFVSTRKKIPVLDNWCPRVRILNDTGLVNDTGEALKYFVNVGRFLTVWGQGHESRRGVIQLTRRHLYKTDRGRRYIFLVYVQRFLYAFRVSVFVADPVDVTLARFSVQVRKSISDLERLKDEQGYIQKLDKDLPSKDHFSKKLRLRFEPEWYVLVKLDTQASTVEADVCSATEGCQLDNFSIALREEISKSVKHVNITEVVLPEKQNDTVFEGATVILSCHLYEGNRKLCMLNSDTDKTLRC